MSINKILYVDDDADDRLFFSDAIHEIDEKIECTEAVNGEDALQYLIGTSILPDILFLDINMPKMNGFELMQRLNADSLLQTIPVIVISTSNIQSDRERLLSLGVDDFIVKPSSSGVLLKEISRVIDRYSS